MSATMAVLIFCLYFILIETFVLSSKACRDPSTEALEKMLFKARRRHNKLDSTEGSHIPLKKLKDDLHLEVVS